MKFTKSTAHRPVATRGPRLAPPTERADSRPRCLPHGRSHLRFDISRLPTTQTVPHQARQLQTPRIFSIHTNRTTPSTPWKTSINTAYQPPCSARSPPYRATSRPAPACSAHLPPPRLLSSAVLHPRVYQRKNRSCSKNCRSNPPAPSLNPNKKTPHHPQHLTCACRSTSPRTQHHQKPNLLSGSRMGRRLRRARNFILI